MNIVIGNIIALIASLLMVYTGVLKNKKRIICLQTIQIGFFVISNLFLKGFSGAIVNAVSMFRNILSYKGLLKLKEKIIITVITIILVLLFNNYGVIGLLPLISMISYIWLMNINDIKKFKILIIFTMLLWLIYDFFIKSYTSTIFDFFTIIANLITLFKLKK